MLKGIEVFEKVAELPDELIDQENGNYEEGMPCCVGAHLANILEGSPSTACHFPATACDFTDGIDAWAELMGGNRAHAILLLRQAGAGMFPIGNCDWDLPVSEVWENLKKIEELPSLVGANLAEEILHYADLSDSDFTKANFTEADLQESVLKNSNFTRADFTFAYMEEANLKGANLFCANLLHANLTDANLTNAILIGADLSNADLSGAILKGANLSSANLKGAKINMAGCIVD